MLNDELQHSATQANTFASALMPIMGNFSHVTYAVLAAVGGAFVIHETLSLGTVLSFLQYSRSFTQPLTNLSQQFNNILSALAGAERIFDVIDQKPETDDGYVRLVNAKRMPTARFRNAPSTREFGLGSTPTLPTGQ